MCLQCIIFLVNAPYYLHKQFSLLVYNALLRHIDNLHSKLCSISSHNTHKDMHVCMYEFVELAYHTMNYNEIQRNRTNIVHMGYVCPVSRVTNLIRSSAIGAVPQ